jgi:hypothetical protein
MEGPEYLTCGREQTKVDSSSDLFFSFQHYSKGKQSYREDYYR